MRTIGLVWLFLLCGASGLSAQKSKPLLKVG